MKSVSMKSQLKLARGKVRYMPETVYAFINYLLPELEETLVPENLVAEISIALLDIESGEVEKILTATGDEASHDLRKKGLRRATLDYIVANRDAVLRDAKFILQVIDDLAENAKLLTGKTEEETEEDVFADRVWALCKEKFGWKPLRRAKVYDRELFRAIYEPNVIAAVEYWTAAVQMVEETEPDDAEHPFTGIGTAEMFRFRDELAQQIAFSLEYNGFAVITTKGGPDQILTRAFDRLACDVCHLPEDIVMCVLHEKVEVTVGEQIDYRSIWRKEN